MLEGENGGVVAVGEVVGSGEGGRFEILRGEEEGEVCGVLEFGVGARGRGIAGGVCEGCAVGAWC